MRRSVDTFPSKGFSGGDQTRQPVMERLGVDAVVAFDDDFAIYRFGPRRERAFRVLR